MPRYERPLTAAERAELQRIRQNRAVRNARREIKNADYFSGAGKALLGLVAAFLGVFWPLIAWHQPNPGAGWGAPTRTGWIVWGIWMAVIVVPIAALILWAKVKESAAKNKTTPPMKPGEKTQEQQDVSELRAQVLAKNGVLLSKIEDPAMRDRVAEIRYGKSSDRL